MKHLGDITKISGYDAPTVNVIIGGSPCQDLSIAGKRAGLDGERSGLFMEQIRIITEMRDKDAGTGRTADLIRPRFMVWENVPGAFSSNKGEDFRIVLEETAKIVEPDAVIPRPPKWKWTTAGCIMGNGWSIAWRVLDAQFWGVPQRRRRIALVADFGGHAAPEILFERESVSGDFTESGAERERTARDAESGADCASRIVIPINTMIATRCEQLGERTGLGIGKDGDSAFTLSCNHSHAVFCLQGNGIDRADTAGCNGRGWKEDVSYTLNTVDRPEVTYSFDSLESNSMKSSNPHSGCRVVQQAKTLDTSIPDPSKNQGGIAILQRRSAGGFNGHKSDRADIQYGNEQCPCIEANMPPDVLTYVADEVNVTSPINASIPKINGPAHTLSATNAARALLTEIYEKQEHGSYRHSLTASTLQAHESKEASDIIMQQAQIVRRLTPPECERLQGYPDGWTDIGDWTDSKGKRRTLSDSARYKALGNSIALPPWFWILSRLNTYCAEKTMASLFDGIGGFTLIWETLNGKGSAVWASEIEEFPIAVTKIRFSDENGG